MAVAATENPGFVRIIATAKTKSNKPFALDLCCGHAGLAAAKHQESIGVVTNTKQPYLL